MFPGLLPLFRKLLESSLIFLILATFRNSVWIFKGSGKCLREAVLISKFCITHLHLKIHTYDKIILTQIFCQSMQCCCLSKLSGTIDRKVFSFINKFPDLKKPLCQIYHIVFCRITDTGRIKYAVWNISFTPFCSELPPLEEVGASGMLTHPFKKFDPLFSGNPYSYRRIHFASTV